MAFERIISGKDWSLRQAARKVEKMSLEDEIKNVRQLRDIHRRYLQKCREIQALQGLSTTPSLLIEIEERESVVEKLSRQLNELEILATQKFEVPEASSHQDLPKKTTKLTTDVRISLKQMLIDLILDYLVETDDIEVNFDSTQKIYNIILSKRTGKQQDDSDQVKNE